MNEPFTCFGITANPYQWFVLIFGVLVLLYSPLHLYYLWTMGPPHFLQRPVTRSTQQQPVATSKAGEMVWRSAPASPPPEPPPSPPAVNAPYPPADWKLAAIDKKPPSHGRPYWELTFVYRYDPDRKPEKRS